MLNSQCPEVGPKVMTMYLFSDTIDYKGHFWFPKALIQTLTWANLPTSAKAVFPVIAAHCRPGQDAFPEQQTIAILAGRTEKTARAGIAHLCSDLRGFNARPYVTARGHRSYRYSVPLPGPEERDAFPFRRCVFEGGNWRRLRPTAQALYPVMRHFGTYNHNDYEEDGDACDMEDFAEAFRLREYDLCEADPDVLTEYAGICSRALESAIASLQDNFLIEHAEELRDGGPFCWKVFLCPPKHWKREYLNRTVAESYRHRHAEREMSRWKKLPVDRGKNCSDLENVACGPVRNSAKTTD